MPRIEKWKIENKHHFYAHEDLDKKYLSGFVYGHPDLEDGTFVTTTRIMQSDFPNKKVRTKNTEYDLGEPRLD